ncbi:glutathione S-transferase family protein [Paracoccus sp. p3-h83]|uniref:glutathione S-transferase family protein n=1 Tax=Paracoccus sp. p3-h83 TaxID=3342805 RepID=UPI0035B78C52
MTLTLYTNPMSRGRIARWMLEEIGQPYQVEYLGYDGAMKAPAYRAINPMGKVPALVHGRRTVTEVAAICAYLADAFPQAGLAPVPDDRADYYRWLFFAAGPLEQAVVNQALGVQVPQDRRGMVGYDTLETTLDAVDQMLQGRDYVTGQFSAADVYLGSHLAWGMQFGTIAARPAFQAYVARGMARPALARANAADDAAMAAMQKG